MSCAREYGDSVFLQNASVVSPLADDGKIVGAHYKCETVLRLAFSQRIQCAYGVMRSRHVQLYVVHPYFQFRVSAHGLDCRLVTLGTCLAADAFLQRILRRYYEVYIIKSRFLGHMLHDRKMTDVKGIERSAVYCNIHSLYVIARPEGPWQSLFFQKSINDTLSLGLGRCKIIIDKHIVKLAGGKLHLGRRLCNASFDSFLSVGSASDESFAKHIH